MENAEIKKCRPFHETVVDEILASSDIGLGVLSKLIKKTSVPKGHDEMLAAWNKRFKEVGLTNDLGVPAHILTEKASAEAKAEAEAETKRRAEEEKTNDQLALWLTRHQIDDIRPLSKVSLPL